MTRLLAVAVAAALVAGCGDDAADSPVSVQVFGDPEELAVYRQVATAYTKETGDEVRLVEVGDREAHVAKLTASAAARRMPDVFLLNHRLIGPFATRKVIDPVGPRLDRGGPLRADDFFAIALDAYRIGGVVQCLPQNVSSLVVYVNLGLFGKAGMTLPEGEWTYGRFLAAARRLKRVAAHAVALDVDTLRVAPFVWGAGGDLVDDVDRPTRFTLDTPAARRGLDALLTLRAEGLAPDRKQNAALAPGERFIAGEVAMFLSSRREVPSLRSIRDFDWDVTRFPVLERPASVLHSDGLCVAAGPRREAARRFVAFALGPAGQRLLARGGRTVPSLRSVARSPDFLAATPPRHNAVFVDQIASMRRVPTTENWSRVEEVVDLALEEAFYGGATIDEALRRIERETRGRF